MSIRIEQLEQFIKEDPSDPFNFYALALEYKGTDEGKALSLFTQLVRDHTDYIPTYYQLAKLYQERGEKEKALLVFEQGIDQARKQNDVKTLRELNSAKEELLFED